jgi:hypothetical protein
MEGTLLDLSDRGLTKLEIPLGESPTALIADRNSITRIENLDQCPQLKQVSQYLILIPVNINPIEIKVIEVT